VRRALLVLLVALSLLVVACGDDDATTPTTTTAAGGDVALELTGPGGTVSLTMADLQAMPATEGWGGFVSSTGAITIPELFRGVSLADLAAEVGGITDGMGLTITAEDGYAMTLSFAQAVNGDFITYDPSTGAEITPSGPLYPIVAYSRNDAPLGDDEGPLRLEVVSDERYQVVDGHWTVKWVTTLEVKEMAAEWTLNIEGLTGETMDRGTFESGANCHEAEWTDDEGRVWSGIPLWLLAGRLDGGPSHGDDSYDDAAAEAGYTIEVIAADGYSATIDSDLFHRNEAIIVANAVDGEALPEEDFPLRLVGDGLSGGEMVSQIVSLVGHFAGVEGGEGDGQAAPGPNAALAITGAVGAEFTLDATTLAGIEVVEITAEHPRDGSRQYTGVRLNDLLDLAEADAAAETLVLTASDGYSVRVGFADVRACADCLVAFNDDGGFDLVLPDMEMSAWVKDVVAIEVL